MDTWTYYIRLDIKMRDLELQFNLGNTPNKDWGTAVESVPYSLSTLNK